MDAIKGLTPFEGEHQKGMCIDFTRQQVSVKYVFFPCRLAPLIGAMIIGNFHWLKTGSGIKSDRYLRT